MTIKTTDLLRNCTVNFIGASQVVVCEATETITVDTTDYKDIVDIDIARLAPDSLTIHMQNTGTTNVTVKGEKYLPGIPAAIEEIYPETTIAAGGTPTTIRCYPREELLPARIKFRAKVASGSTTLIVTVRAVKEIRL